MFLIYLSPAWYRQQRQDLCERRRKHHSPRRQEERQSKIKLREVLQILINLNSEVTFGINLMLCTKIQVSNFNKFIIRLRHRFTYLA